MVLVLIIQGGVKMIFNLELVKDLPLNSGHHTQDADGFCVKSIVAQSMVVTNKKMSWLDRLTLLREEDPSLSMILDIYESQLRLGTPGSDIKNALLGTLKNSMEV